MTISLKILCLNIWHGGKLRDPLLRFIREIDADILMFQEVYEDQDLGLVEYPYRHYAPEFLHLIDEEQHVIGNAVYSKYPIVRSNVRFFFEPYGIGDESKRETYPYLPRNVEYVVLDVSGRELNVFNTHGIWGEDGNDTERRIRLSEILLEEIKGKDLVVLGGDFNVAEHTRAMTMLGEQLLDVFKNERTTSFNMKQKDLLSSYARTVVDFLFVSHEIRVLSHESPQVDISDHLPLVATIEIVG